MAARTLAAARSPAIARTLASARTVLTKPRPGLYLPTDMGSDLKFWTPVGRSLGNGADGSAVSLLRDLSANGYHLNTVSVAPILKQGIKNGKAVLRFTAASSHAIGRASSDLASLLQGAFKLTIACAPSSLPANARLWSAGSSTDADPFVDMEFSSPNWLFSRRDNNSVFKSVAAGTPTTGVWEIDTYDFDGTTCTPYINGVAGTPTDLSGTLTLDRFALGALLRAAYTNFYGGDIADVILYTGNYRQQNERYMAAEYDIALAA